MSLTKLRKQRNGYILALANMEKWISANTAAQPEEEDLLGRIGMLDECTVKLSEVCVKISEAHTDDDDPEADYTAEVTIAERIVAASTALKKLMRSFKKPDMKPELSLQDTTKPAPILELKLPAVPIPHFTGRSIDWLEFKDQFLNIVSKTSAESQKMELLKIALQGSEAESMVRGIASTNLSFGSAWKALEDRYDNLWLLIEQHLTAIFNTEPVQKEDATKLRALVDQFNHQVNVLEKLGQSTKQWSTILAFMLEQRIDNASKRDWRTKSGVKTVPKFEDLANFILERCNILDSIAPANEQPEVIAPVRKAVHHNRSLGLPLIESSLQRSCKLCQQTHTLFQCPEFRHMSVQDRNSYVAEKRLCYNCLSDAHFLNRCNSQSNCRIAGCNKRHNTLLHADTPASLNVSAIPWMSTNATTTAAPTPESCNAVGGREEMCKVLLSTALVTVYDRSGRQHPARAFIDSGSMSSYVTKKLAEKLGMKCRSTRIPVQGLGGTPMQNITSATNIVIQSLHSDFKATVDCLIIEKILEQLPTEKVDITHWKLEQAHDQLADPLFYCPDKIDLLLGNDVLSQIFKDGGRIIKLGDGLPTLIETELGYLVGGRYTQPPSLSCALSTDVTGPLICATAEIGLEAQLRKFWEIEDIEAGDRALTPEQHDAEEHFKATTKLANGRFCVRLPFKKGVPRLGESRSSALKSFFFLERRLSKDKSLREQYVSFMKEMLELGHMKMVDPHTITPRDANYIPHHPVIKEESITTKVRVVLNASKRTSNGHSLNDELLVGPVIQPDLIEILERFRCKPVALVADVTKMYRQIQVHPDDRRFQRIFWRDSPQLPLREYELCTVIYGTSSASFQATRCIQEMAQRSMSEHPEAAKAAARDTYVDDVASGSKHVDEAIRLRKSLQTMFGDFGFELRKWNSNRAEVIRSVAEDPICQQTPLMIAGEANTKVLGIRWDTDSDTLRYDVIACESANTKRAVLATIAKIYDPLGLISPFVIKAKILLQMIWRNGHDWDEELSGDLLRRWQQFAQEMQSLTQIQFPRCIAGLGQSYELVVFVDASEAAYAATAYIITIDDNQVRSSNVFLAKTRAAPVRKVTLPRLELMAAVLGANLIRHLKRSLDIEFSRIDLYTDSKIVLAWLNGDQNRWKTFVANRTAVILGTLPAAHCHHIRSEENPADPPTRGMSPHEIENSELWKHGPPWLRKAQKDEVTITQLSVEELEAISSEEKQIEIAATTVVVAKEDCMLKIIDRCRSLQKIVNTVARLYRVFRPSSGGTLESPSASEYKEAHDRVVLAVQNSEFSKEMGALRGGNPVSHSSSLRSLTPILDSQGLMRVGGRLAAAELSFAAKHPVILPAGHRLTDLIMLAEHRRLMHCGPQQLLSQVRQQYWPIRGKSTARKIYRCCMQCFKAEPRRTDQLMGDLPSDRCTFSPAFTVTGVDLSGPHDTCETKGRGKTTYNSYVAHFVCFATKAVHLERVSELSTAAFMAAFERFVNRRGLPKKMWSDNGSNFVGARNELRKVQELVNGKQLQERIRKDFAPRGLEWEMIPARSPSVGGLWEAAVRAMKRIMNRVLTSHRLTFEEFDTFLTAVEATLNSRPLTDDCDDPDDVLLTPAHFLILRPLFPLPREVDCETRMTLLRRWKLTVRLQEDFKQAWNAFYLQKLTQRDKWRVVRENFERDEVVLLVEEDQKSYGWRRGRITEVMTGKDGLVRMVKLRCVHPGGSTTYETTRAVNKICKLPDVNLVGGMSATATDKVADDVTRKDSCCAPTGDSAFGSLKLIR